MRGVEAEANRLKFTKMAEMIKKDYEGKGNRSKDRLEHHLNSLQGFFGDVRAVDITAERIEDYVDYCQKNGEAFGTIQNRLAASKRMSTLAERKMLINQRPAFPVIAKSKPRKGFFDPDPFWAVHQQLPEDIQPVAEFGYYTGWRGNEILGMKRDQVDFEGGSVKVWPGTTENDEGRVFPFALLPALKTLLEKQDAYTKAVDKATGKKIDRVFHRNGRRIKAFKNAWKTACDKAGVPGRIFHDLRRTAVRNLVRAGVPERIAMVLTGYRTRAVFERYNIVDKRDLMEGVSKLAAFFGQHPPAPVESESKTTEKPAEEKLGVSSCRPAA
jgi:integrase